MDEYRSLAHDLVDYLSTCNAHNAVPLLWDINHFTAKMHEIEKRQSRRKRIDQLHQPVQRH